jgi:hypothetical protein
MQKKFTMSRLASWTLFLTVIALVWLYPLIAHAQGSGSGDGSGASSGASGADTTSPLGEVLLTAVKIVFTILGGIATFLTLKAIKYFEKKTKIDIPQATEDLIFSWADKAIGFAHEKAHQVIQKTGKSLSGPEKLDIAVAFVMGLVTKYGLDTSIENKLRDYIEAKLGMKRIEGADMQPAVAGGAPT